MLRKYKWYIKGAALGVLLTGLGFNLFTHPWKFAEMTWAFLVVCIWE
jgi:hypothetical protein